MNIRVVNYTPSCSPLVQAFVAVEIDGWLRFNGLNFFRDGSLHPAQLTPRRDEKRWFIDAVQVLDEDLAKLLAADILDAIHAHIELLPVERRLRPPVAPKSRSKPNQPPAAQGDVTKGSARNGKPAETSKTAAAPPPKAIPSPVPKLKPLPPPQRLLAPRPLRPLAGGAK